MPNWTKDIWTFLRSVIWWWIKTVGGEVVAFFQIWYAIRYQTWPPVMSWVVLGFSLLVAVFFVWREEHQKAKGKPRQEILQNITDKFYRQKNSGQLHIGWLGLIIEHSSDFSDYKDLDWLCSKLSDQHHGNPFETFLLLYSPKSFDGK